MAHDNPADKAQQVFFVDDDLIERLLRGDPAPVPAKQQRPALSSSLAPAIELASAGKLDEAVQKLESALHHTENARGEKAAEIHNGLGHLRFEQQDWNRAERHYAKAVEQEPKNTAARYNLALCLERQEKFEAAAQAFEAALSIDPKRWQAQIGRGLCLLRLNRPDAALPCWEAALSNIPPAKNDQRKNDILFGKAVALHQLGRLEEASDIYNELLPASPNSIDLLANLTTLSIARKDTARAKEMAERLFKIRPESPVALEGLAAAALSRGDYGAAAQHCSQLLKVAGESFEVCFNLGVAYHKTGRLEQAANAYRDALRLRPGAAEANANLGAALQERGDVAGAREAYRGALEGSPDLPGALWNLAIAAEREGNAAEAEEHLEKLLAADQNWQDASFRLGYLRLKRGEFAGAVDCFEACLKQRKDWPEALLNLGVAFWKFEDLEGAVDAFRQVLAINPKNADALRYLAAVAIEQKNSSEAREIVGKLGSLGTPTPELQYNLGLLLQSTGDYGAAAECYRVTLQHKPEFSAAMINLGHALKANGQDEEARIAWSQAAAADPALAAKYVH
jgi:tetratricopeptide (TPR) repeat protein